LDQPCSVVCVSRTLAAGGEDIAHIVAKELGFRYADELIVRRAAEAAGVNPNDVIHAEQTPGLVGRILESIGRTTAASEGAYLHGAGLLDVTPDYEALVGKVVREVAAEGKVVIVAHGASIPLAGSPGVVRVLVTGSPETRARRLAQEQGVDEGKAKRAIRDSDDQRKSFLRRFYDVSEESPHHYDLVINTDSLSPEQATRIILFAARGR
jgi:cytidylate kinase